MKFVIITGMSGAGKSQAIKIFEDIGYYCIDNMPPKLFSKVAEVLSQSDSGLSKIAFAIDTRSASMYSELCSCIDEFESANGKCEILFLDADSQVLVKRYKESRRNHPLSSGSVLEGIEAERALVKDVRSRASYIVDTSNMKPKQLKDYITTVFTEGVNERNTISVNVMSFGFKYGIPMDADLVFDVRFLPNPFYIPELKEKTGLDREVFEYVLSFELSKDFVNRLNDMISFLLPNYINEGKSNLVIAIGCTGGKHRSVTVANELAKYLTDNGYNTFASHRDINKDRVAH
ncbi:MAG: RNase adapter RapZ [Clostridia bacterium]|nr:RNase adapter RapZ [Clostridia bacterium]